MDDFIEFNGKNGKNIDISSLTNNSDSIRSDSDQGDDITHASTRSKSFENVIVDLAIHAIDANPLQPRKEFKEEELKSLAGSIKEEGIIQPIIVSRGETPHRYVLIAGERRLRAAHEAGIKSVPAIIRNVTADERLRIALIENIQRSDLNPIEEASAYLSLINDFGLTQQECAQKVGKDRATIANLLRLLFLPAIIQDDIKANRLSIGHGKSLLSLEDEGLIQRARALILKKSLNVRQTEQLCKKINKNDKSSTAGTAQSENADLAYLAENLRSQLRTKVRMLGSSNRGKIEISYFSASELERILSLIGLGDF